MKLKKKKSIILGSIGLIVFFLCAFFIQNRWQKPNIILITIDALRADHLGCYGYSRNTSPYIDSLARKGILFTQAIAAGTHTPPSMGTISTGLPPYEHMLLRWGNTLKASVTLAELFLRNGYRTAFFCANDAFRNGLHGFNRGFQIWVESGDYQVLTGTATDFMRKERAHPFFVWIHYMNTHASYNANPAYIPLFTKDRFYDQNKSLPIVEPYSGGYGLGGIPKPLARDNGGITNPDFYVALYDAAIKTVDDEIGKILASLSRLRLSKRTIIIITADHGEMLGEHNYYFHHGRFLYDKMLNVPFIIYAEGNISKKHVVKKQVGAHLILFPMFKKAFTSQFFRFFWEKNMLKNVVSLESPEYFLVDDSVTQKCIRTDEWKLILNFRKSVYEQYHSSDYELYNIKNDPYERENLVLLEPEIFQRLKGRLQSVMIQAAQSYNNNKRILDDETKERLRLLGYVQ